MTGKPHRPSGRLILLTSALALVTAAFVIRERLWLPPDQVLDTMPLPRLLSLARSHPESERVYVALGLRLLEAGRVYEAFAAFEQAATIEPNSARSLQGMGRVLASQQKWEEAGQYFRWCLRLNPDLTSARRELAVILQGSGNWEEAAAHLERLTAANPSDYEACYRLGQCLGRIGHHRDAVRALGSAVRQQPDNPDYRKALDRELERGGRR